MNNAPSDENQKLFESIYGISDFYTFFEQMRFMGQNYLFGGAYADKKLSELVYGYNETRFSYIFKNQTNEMTTDDFFSGDDIDIDPFITPVLPIKSERVNNQTVSIYTGSENMEKVARVRFVNLKDYVNV